MRQCENFKTVFLFHNCGFYEIQLSMFTYKEKQEEEKTVRLLGYLIQGKFSYLFRFFECVLLERTYYIRFDKPKTYLLNVFKWHMRMIVNNIFPEMYKVIIF